jgi:hypothetical protein
MRPSVVNSSSKNILIGSNVDSMVSNSIVLGNDVTATINNGLFVSKNLASLSSDTVLVYNPVSGMIGPAIVSPTGITGPTGPVGSIKSLPIITYQYSNNPTINNNTDTTLIFNNINSSRSNGIVSINNISSSYNSTSLSILSLNISAQLTISQFTANKIDLWIKRISDNNILGRKSFIPSPNYTTYCELNCSFILLIFFFIYYSNIRLI